MTHGFATVARKSRSGIYLAILVLLLPSPTFADTITIFADRDTTIFRDLPSNSDGGGAAMYVGTTTMSAPRRALIDFDIADNLPAGAIITGVRLTLTLEQTAPAERQARSIELHRLLDDWGEGTTGRGGPATRTGRGFPTTADGTAATWTHRFYNTTPWTTAGGDFAPLASGSTMVGTSRGAYVWDSMPGMVSDVQSWLDDPASNFGWILLGVESAASTARRFDTREAANSALWPSLEITYSGGAVPAPSSLTLLAVGAAGTLGYILRRRKRVRESFPGTEPKRS
jgi:hypothetical protein